MIIAHPIVAHVVPQTKLKTNSRAPKRYDTNMQINKKVQSKGHYTHFHFTAVVDSTSLNLQKQGSSAFGGKKSIMHALNSCSFPTIIFVSKLRQYHNPGQLHQMDTRHHDKKTQLDSTLTNPLFTYLLCTFSQNVPHTSLSTLDNVSNKVGGLESKSQR